MRLLICTQKVNKNDSILGFFHEWIKHFSKYFDSITVICLEKGEYDLPQNVEVLSLGKEEGVSKIGYILRFYKYIFSRRDKYDVVFVHMNQIYVILGYLIWSMFHKKIFLWYTHKQITLSLRIAEKLCTKIFTASKESFRLNSNKVIVTGHGIDVDMFKPNEKNTRDHSRFNIVSVGRISPIKRCDLLVDVAESLSYSIKIARIEIWGEAINKGDISYHESLLNRIKNKSLNNIFFMGKVINSDLNKVLNRSDLFINMSSTGSLDKAILESMASGVPVITSNKAFKDIMSNYPRLFIKDDIASLLETIDYVYNMSNEEYTEILRYYREFVIKNHSLSDLILNLSLKIKRC